MARDAVNAAREAENKEVIDTHLDSAYQQALRVEEFNASIRGLIAQKLSLAKSDL